MIFWLNGAYGVGKTTVSEKLKELLYNAHIFDPELVGNGVRDNYPDALFRETFEEYPVWLEANYRILKDLYENYDGDIIAPMTLIREGSYENMIKRLMDDGIPVRYIYLDADYETLYDRMVGNGRETEDSWCVGHIPVCLKVQEEDRFAVHVNTVGRSPEDIAREIADLK